MHRTFISTVIAAALTITGVSSTMAQAGEYRYVPQPQYRSQGGNEAVAATLAGIATLFIIGKTIENNGGFKKKTHRSKQQVHTKRHSPRNRAYNGHRKHSAHRAQRSHKSRRHYQRRH